MPLTNILQPIAISPISMSNNGLRTTTDKTTLAGLVTNTFFINAGTGEFIVGADI